MKLQIYFVHMDLEKYGLTKELVMLMLYLINFVRLPQICIYKIFIVIYKTGIKRFFIDI